MATDSRTTGGATPPPDASSLSRSVSDALGQADQTVAGRLQLLQQVHLSRASALSRRADALKAEYGANDAGVKSAEAAVAASQAASVQVAAARLRFATPDPEVAADGWVLQGRVFDESGAPVPGFTVFLANEAKTYQQAYGFSSTDATGHFLLRFDGAASSDKAAAAAKAGEPALFVEVADLKGRLAYVSDTPFVRVAGAAVYQDINLTGSASTRGDVPAQIRRVATPRRDTK
jgi:hypothetical protein